MLRVGLTGGYASGKTFVASEFERLGCHIIHADALGHATLQPAGAAYQATIELFGRDILLADDTIDRKKLASIVFASAEQLRKLNAIVHPAVFRLEEQMLAEFKVRDPGGIAMLEAAILVETGRYAQCDKLIVVICDREEQIARGMKRDGVAREAIVARLDKQLTAEEKKSYADYVIDTNGGKEETVRQVKDVFGALKPFAEAAAP